MSTTEVTRATRSLGARVSWPWWVRVLAVYAGARALSAVVLVIAARSQRANYFTGASPSYGAYAGDMWDGYWYRLIATQGYPQALPIGADGAVEQNAWAFFPLFPTLVRGVMVPTGLSWQVVAPTLSLVLGGFAMLVVHELVVAGAPRAVTARPGLPLATVALVSLFPSAVVLQLAYTESLALLLVAGALLALVRRSYGVTALILLALGFTRAVALPLAVVVVVHALARARVARADPTEAWGARQVATLGSLTVLAVISGLAWPVVCGVVTGVPDGYLRTQAAWRGAAGVTPIEPWFVIGRWLFGDLGSAVVLGALAALVLVVASRPARRLGPELLAWTGAYLAYLVVVVEPGTSLLRFLLLAFPLGAATAGIAHERPWLRRAWLAVAAVAMLASQVWWVMHLWRLTSPQGWPP